MSTQIVKCPECSSEDYKELSSKNSNIKCIIKVSCFCNNCKTSFSYTILNNYKCL